jgi:hypothetical protein
MCNCKGGKNLFPIVNAGRNHAGEISGDGEQRVSAAFNVR